MKSYIVLENGKIFEGVRIGSKRNSIFNIVINTGITGYTEILTDPAMYGEGIVFSACQIGNNKVNLEECESQGIYASCAIFNSIANFNDIPVPNNDDEQSMAFSNIITIQEFLKRFDVPGITEVDVKSLIKEIKTSNIVKAAICDDVKDIEQIKKEIADFKVSNTCTKISTDNIRSFGRTKAKQVAIIDTGVKDSIINEFLKRDVGVTVYPLKTQAEFLLATRPNGIVIPNGPGDPNELRDLELLNKINKTTLPILAIGLGSLLIAIQNNITVKKLDVVKIGQNYTVKDLSNNTLSVVSQNNKYGIVETTLMSSTVEATFIDLYNNDIMGLNYAGKNILSVFFNPEGCPGPKDANYIFDEFCKML